MSKKIRVLFSVILFFMTIFGLGYPKVSLGYAQEENAFLNYDEYVNNEKNNSNVYSEMCSRDVYVGLKGYLDK